MRERVVLSMTPKFLVCLSGMVVTFAAMETSKGQSGEEGAWRFGKECHELSFEYIQFEITVKEMVFL